MHRAANGILFPRVSRATSPENPFTERTDESFVLSLLKFCGTHRSTALVRFCRDAFPSSAITNTYNIRENYYKKCYLEKLNQLLLSA